MFARYNHISLKGFLAAVPDNLVSIRELMEKSSPEDRFTLKRVAALAGLEQRYACPAHLYTGDLALGAARKILESLDWDPQSLGALFFVSQTPDFLSPPTGYLIGGALGVDKNCFVTDVSSGCPGMIHGALLASALMGENCRRALILSGDAASKTIPQGDIGNSVLMGDAVGALALEFDADAPPVAFNTLGFPDTDLSLVNYNSGYRPMDGDLDGMVMDGNRITEFCLSSAPECIRGLLDREGLTLDDIEILFLHQPNKMILDTLARRLKVDKKRVPMIFRNYANCSSASLPINVCSCDHKADGPRLALF
nr:hypothetical protein [Desulfovibrio sp.]